MNKWLSVELSLLLLVFLVAGVGLFSLGSGASVGDSSGYAGGGLVDANNELSGQLRWKAGQKVIDNLRNKKPRPPKPALVPVATSLGFAVILDDYYQLPTINGVKLSERVINNITAELLAINIPAVGNLVRTHWWKNNVFLNDVVNGKTNYVLIRADAKNLRFLMSGRASKEDYEVASKVSKALTNVASSTVFNKPGNEWTLLDVS